MKKMIITRYKDGEDFTLGKFILLNDTNDIVQEGFTLEPAGPDTIQRGQDRRIPIGNYETYIRFSPKFKSDTVLLFNENVSSNRYILIHRGNDGDDTEGCILVGNRATKDSILDSRSAYNTLMNNISGEQFVIKIV